MHWIAGSSHLMMRCKHGDQDAKVSQLAWPSVLVMEDEPAAISL